MRLDQSFTRLPIRFDDEALAAEIGRVPEEAWQVHPSGFPGNDALLLLSKDGDPHDDATHGPMRPTPVLAELPYVRQVLAGLETVIGRTRLMRIGPEAEASPHVDTAYYWWDRVRVHVPVRTNPGVAFHCGDDQVHMAAGETWVFNTWKRHRVTNPGPLPRIHLVADTVGSGSFWQLVARGEAAPEADGRLVPHRLGAELAYPLETVNLPVVMSPWELDRKVDDVLRDLARSEPEASVVLRDVLEEHRRQWRATWAVHGAARSGWATFTQLVDRASRALIGHEGRYAHDNGMDVVEVLRTVCLRAALNPHLARSSGAGGQAPAVPAAPAPVQRRVERPIVVVSSPRSGSSLLFETLARAPGLCTIGGESHQLIESIPSLRPSERGWPSNALRASDATPQVVQPLHDLFRANARDRNRQKPPAGPVRLLEKTPKNALRVPFLAEAFPDATFVYLYRDPRETISSMLDAWRSGRFVTYPDLPDWDGLPWSLLLTPGWRELIDKPLAEVVVDQWMVTTQALLDDLEALGPERWCVASYDRLVADPAAEIAQLCEHLDLEWDVDLGAELPESRHTLDSPHPDKWRRNAEELEPVWDRIRPLALRAHDVFADPPRVKPVQPPASTRGPRPPGQGDGRATAELEQALRSVYTPAFPELLERLGASLLVSTYQSGRVIAVRSRNGKLNTHFRSFPSPMGMARDGNLLAIGTGQGVWVYQNQPAVTAKLEPKGVHDACFLPRTQHVTGDIRIHDIAFSGGDLWIVNTRFSCLSTLDGVHSFVPRWRPPFISGLAPEDRCHLNGIALIDGQVRLASALGTTDTAAGWREQKADGGVLMEVPSGEIVARGLSMPHSPRVRDGKLWILESGHGSLATVDLDTGKVETVAHLPGFTRGLAFAGPYAFIGLSQVREHLFGGLPLTEHLTQRVCGVWVVDTRSGEIVTFLRFEGQVQEIYDIQLLPHRYPELVEPGAELVSGSFVLSDDALAQVPSVPLPT